jgi:hypothetical protein
MSKIEQARKVAKDKFSDYNMTTEDRLWIYKQIIQLINNKDLDKETSIGRKRDIDKIKMVNTVKGYLKDNNVPITDQTLLAYLNTYVELTN